MRFFAPACRGATPAFSLSPPHRNIRLLKKVSPIGAAIFFLFGTGTGTRWSASASWQCSRRLRAAFSHAGGHCYRGAGLMATHMDGKNEYRASGLNCVSFAGGGSQTANAALLKATLALDRMERREAECGLALAWNFIGYDLLNWLRLAFLPTMPVLSSGQPALGGAETLITAPMRVLGPDF
jgi:hypothetical protein